MKKYALYISLIVSLFILAGCGSLLNKNKGMEGVASKKEEKAAKVIDKIDLSLNKANDQKLEKIGEFSFGTSYSLNKVTNPEPAVIVAKDLNERVQNLSTQPGIDQIKMMKALVEDLISNNIAGQRELSKKDLEISNLQKNISQLTDNKDKAITSYRDIADKNAALADQYRSTLSSMDSMFGLGALIYGFKRLFLSCMWFFIIFGVIFLILRFASMSNPIAASLFGIFEHFVSWIINTIQVLFPKALSIAGNVSKKTFDASSNLLKKIIDNIQQIKLLESKLGRKITVEELLLELDKSLNDDQKDEIKTIKRQLGY